MTIPEIFQRDGEPFFRSKETQVIGRLLDEEKGILSTGGGAFLADTPAGPSIVCAAAVLFAVTALLGPMIQRAGTR